MTTPAQPQARAGVRALVLACGNSLRGDDGVGQRIGQALQDQPASPNLEVILTQQLLPEHAAPVSQADVVVFVDCSAVSTPGAVSIIPLDPAETLPRIFTHHLDPAALLRLAADLYGRLPARVSIVTIGGVAFELCETLTPAVEAAIPAALAAIRRQLSF